MRSGSFWLGVFAGAPIWTLAGIAFHALRRVNRDVEDRLAVWQAGRAAGRFEVAVRYPDVIPIESALEGTDLGVGADRHPSTFDFDEGA